MKDLFAIFVDDYVIVMAMFVLAVLLLLSHALFLDRMKLDLTLE